MSKEKKSLMKIRRRLVLIPARYFYEGLLQVIKLEIIKDYIDIQCQTYRKD